MPRQNFLDWTEPPFASAEFHTRRTNLLRLLDGGIFFTPSRYHLSDGTTFRQLDDFLYFTGLELPDSILAIDGQSGDVILFVPERDPRFDNRSRPTEFPGRLLLSDAAIRAAFGIADFRPIDAFDDYVNSLALSGRNVYVNCGTGPLQPVVSNYINKWTALDAFRFHLQRQHPTLNLASAYPLIARLRMIKSSAEIDVMRRACDITMDSIIETARHIRPGVDERTLEGILESGFKRSGAQRLPFASIIKSGPNALWPWRILASHYNRRNRPMQAGEMVVFDVGCEVDYYGADMGRTFPVSDHFSVKQTAVLDMQLSVLDAIIDVMRPGITMRDAHQAAELAIPAHAKPYMQVGHFFGHHIGLAAGDPARPDAPFEPGMIITVEPWYYNHDDGVATFIEDVILITPSGCENLSQRLPRTAAGMAATAHA